jgi:hypothetical protein
MTGLFLAPATDRKGAYGHFRKTVLDGVPSELHGEHTDEESGSTPLVWGLTSSIESTWEGVEESDWVLFYTRENEYCHAARVAAKEHNPELGDAIRKEMLEDVSDDRDWDFLLYLDDPVSVSASGDEVADLLDYGNRFPVRFIRVTDERLESLKAEYGDVDRFINAIRE